MKKAETELGFPVDVAELLSERGIDTAERLRARKPEIVEACIRILGHGIAAKKCAELLGLDIRAVLQIQREAETSGAIPPYKERTLAQIRAVVTLGLDSLLDKAREGKISPIELCALIDKGELLSGGATSRVEHTEDEATREFRRFLAATDRGALGGGQKGARASGAGPVIEAEAVAEEGARDTECPADVA